MTILHVLAGWVAWSLTHYLLHRAYHWAILASAARPRGLKFIIDGEELHHVIYDDRPPDTSRDPDARSVTFPVVLATPVIVVAAALWFLWFGLVACTAFIGGLVLTMLIDDQTHKRSHPRRGVEAYHRGNFLQRVHDCHHDSFWLARNKHSNRVYNYGFCTGIVWDFVFGTWKSPSRTRHPATGLDRFEPGAKR